jgi:hypothetical protein
MADSSVVRLGHDAGCGCPECETTCPDCERWADECECLTRAEMECQDWIELTRCAREAMR